VLNARVNAAPSAHKGIMSPSVVPRAQNTGLAERRRALPAEVGCSLVRDLPNPVGTYQGVKVEIIVVPTKSH
jgi:hypothetical protein